MSDMANIFDFQTYKDKIDIKTEPYLDSLNTMLKHISKTFDLVDTMKGFDGGIIKTKDGYSIMFDNGVTLYNYPIITPQSHEEALMMALGFCGDFIREYMQDPKDTEEIIDEMARCYENSRKEDRKLEKTRKECIKAIRDYEAVGFGLVENVKETADMIGAMFKMDLPEAEQKGKAFFDLYMVSVITLAQYCLEKDELRDYKRPDFFPALIEWRDSTGRRRKEY